MGGEDEVMNRNDESIVASSDAVNRMDLNGEQTTQVDSSGDESTTTTTGDAAAAATPSTTPSSSSAASATSKTGDNVGGEVAEAATTPMETDDDPMDTEDDDSDAYNDLDKKDDKKDEDDDKSKTPEERLVKAMEYKEEGNNCFKANNLTDAARAYRRGCNQLKNLNENNTGDDQVKTLLLALLTNLSMVLFKQEKYKMSADTATRALNVDPVHVKALYRRALAHRKRGDLEPARNDLKQALMADPNNTACKKELVAVKKELEQVKESQKKALAKAFSSKSGSSFLYNDKEAELKKKEEQAALKKKKEQELYKQRKQQWEDECVKRMAKNEPAISFDEWEKELKAEEEKKIKEEERKKKEETDRIKEERRRAKAEAKKQKKKEKNDDEDDDELTEQELAMMRGYKKTADGRTTSYFTRELSEEEKKVLGNTAPKRLDEQNPHAPQPLAPAPQNAPVAASASRPSAWNQAGTWEEKDTTSWCNSQLRKRLEETSSTLENLEAKITKIEELTGDASVAIAGGKKRYIFDFHVKLKYKIMDAETDDVVASGVVRLPDICSTDHEELEVSFEGWKRRPSESNEEKALNLRSVLVESLRASVRQWVLDFNSQY